MQFGAMSSLVQPLQKQLAGSCAHFELIQKLSVLTYLNSLSGLSLFIEVLKDILSFPTVYRTPRLDQRLIFYEYFYYRTTI